jgi:hypothetical protein
MNLGFVLLVKQSSDGICKWFEKFRPLSRTTNEPPHAFHRTDYMSCTQLISVSFIFNGQEYAVHPIDMSDYTSDSGQCRGSMQYSDNLAAGDVILGSSFLKNV